MMECPGSDALATIAAALDWNVEEALEHVRTCADCRGRLATLTATHAAFQADEMVPEYVVARITGAIAGEARGNAERARAGERTARAIEAVLAGATALVIVLAAGTPSANVAALAATFAIGAMVPLAPRARLRRRF